MSLIFIDGFDHYTSSEIGKKWDVVGSNSGFNPEIYSTSGRRGGGALRGVFSVSVRKNVPQGNSWVIGFAYNLSALPGGNHSIVTLRDPTTNIHCQLGINAGGQLYIARNGTVLQTSTFTYSTNQWSYIEWKVTVADSTSSNSCVVRVNGVSVLNLTAGSDIKNTSDPVGSIEFSPSSQFSSPGFIDDLYICNQSGSTNNDFLGDCRVDSVLPTADGTYADGTPSTGTAHYATVDEATPNTTDYVALDTVGQKDSYNFPDLPTVVSPTVYGVQVNPYWLKDDAGSRTATTFVRSGTTDQDGASVALSTSAVYSPQVYETNPATSTAWTQTTVNAAEFGVKVVS